MKLKLVMVAVFAAVLFAFLTVAGAGEDPVKVAPKNYKVLLANDEVRVLEFTAKAGDKIAMHWHPDHTVYVIHGGKAKFTADGKTTEMDMKDGEALFMKAGDHSVEVIGPGDVKVIVVEMTEEVKKK